MLQFVEGDFFDYEADIRVNTVNCVGVMGAGVALLFKNKYPKMYEDYVKECNLGRVKIGKPHVWQDAQMFNKKTPIIINLPTKDHWKKPSEYEFVEKGLTWLKQYLQDKGNVIITLPALGCGHGGLDWDVVKELITNRLDGLQAQILVFAPSSSTKKVIPLETIVELNQKDIQKISPNDFSYPKKLKGKSATDIYIKGNVKIFDDKILSIIVDTKANDRERNAVLKCLEILPSKGIVYMLGFNSSFEIDLVKEVLAKKAKVILIIPYGILSLKIRKDLVPFWDASNITVISITEPKQTWKVDQSINALKLRFKLSDAVLIANYNYEILKRFETDLKEINTETFYINYWTDKVEFYNKINARQIGRNKETHLPNMNPILEHLH